MNKNLFFLLFSLSLSIILFGCKSKKAIQQTPAVDKYSSEIYDSLSNHHLDFDWFVAEGKGKYQMNDKSISTKTYLRLKKDSIIWIVIKKFSAESNRILLTPDSFFILYRLEQKFERGSLSNLLATNQIDFSFSELQDFLAGNVPLVDSSAYKNTIENNFNTITFPYRELMAKLYLNPSDLTIHHGFVQDDKMQTIRLIMDDYRLRPDGHKIPYFREYLFDFENGDEAKAQFEFSEIDINVPKKTRFTIPDYYDEI